MGKASRTKSEATRREKIAAQRAAQRRAEKRRRVIMISAIASAAVIIIGVIVGYVATSGGGTTSHEAIPPGVSSENLRVFVSPARFGNFALRGRDCVEGALVFVEN